MGGLAAAGVESWFGDLADPASLARAVEGQDVVIHAAARVSDWGSRAEFWRANVEGTRNLLEACLAAGAAPPLVVHISTLTVLGLPRDGRALDERSPVAPAAGLELDPYSESKLAAEALVAAFAARGLPAVIVRPGAVWGPGDTVFVPRLARLLRAGLCPRVGAGANRVSLAHIDNVTAGILLAAAAPRPSPAASGVPIYHLTDGEELTVRDALEGLARALGCRPPWLSLPFPVAAGVASAVEWTTRALGVRRPPPVTRYGVRLLATSCRYDIGKARRELGYRPSVTFRAGMEELARRGL